MQLCRYHPTTTISIIKTCDILLSDKLQVCIQECWAICLLYDPLRGFSFKILIPPKSNTIDLKKTTVLNKMPPNLKTLVISQCQIS